MNCTICKGNLMQIKEKFLVTIKGQDILIKNLEILECENCGERYLTPETDEKLERLILKYKQGNIPITHQDIIQLEV
ncbi:MAG: type II toxin-antitoxin system MqsA family antitoxin [Promethearchaeota archaeon]